MTPIDEETIPADRAIPVSERARDPQMAQEQPHDVDQVHADGREQTVDLR